MTLPHTMPQPSTDMGYDTFNQIVDQVDIISENLNNKKVSNELISQSIHRLKELFYRYGDEHTELCKIVNSMKTTIDKITQENIELLRDNNDFKRDIELLKIENAKLRQDIRSLHQTVENMETVNRAFLFYEYCQRIEYNCIKAVLNFDDNDLKLAGIDNYSTFLQHVNKNLDSSYINSYRTKLKNLLGKHVANNFRKIKNVRNRVAHPAVCSVSNILDTEIDRTSHFLNIDPNFLRKIIKVNNQFPDTEDDYDW